MEEIPPSIEKPVQPDVRWHRVGAFNVRRSPAGMERASISTQSGASLSACRDDLRSWRAFVQADGGSNKGSGHFRLLVDTCGRSGRKNKNQDPGRSLKSFSLGA